MNPESPWQPGLGWFLSRRSGNPITKPTTLPDRLYVAHSGGSVGGTTVLLLSLPCEIYSERRQERSVDLASQISQLPPICVAVLCNLEDAPGMTDLAVTLVELVADCAVHAPS
ncbi:unnamed protein product [Dicrocoelium dendriticum]|nr:unnamed protein product [Dicrocoelium dendriticum]